MPQVNCAFRLEPEKRATRQSARERYLFEDGREISTVQERRGSRQ